MKFCCDGQSTIAYLSSVSTDVKYHTSCCILELSLPNMHGAELVDLLRELEDLEHLKFVVFSGSIDSLTEEHVRMLNGCRTVKKPSSLLEVQEQFWEIFSSCEGASRQLRPI